MSMRYAIVWAPPETVKVYLPSNYEVVGDLAPDSRPMTIIAGEDRMGWTLDEYVIPRLASAPYAAIELMPKPAYEQRTAILEAEVEDAKRLAAQRRTEIAELEAEVKYYRER